jgi:hexulose-6-phosphate isomerase
MIPGVNQWSLPVGEQDLLAVLQQAVKAKLPNVELCIEPVAARELGDVAPEPELDELFQRVARAVNAKQYLLKLFASNKELDGLKSVFARAGAKVISVTTLDLFRYTITSDDPKTRGAAELIIRRMVELCSYLGGSIVLIEPGVVTSSLSYRDAYKNCRESIKRLARYAEERNVTLALENVWGKFLLSPLEFRGLLDEVGSEAVGAYFDVANILEYGFPQDWLRILAEKVKSIHFKDYRSGVGAAGFCNPFDGEVGWVAVRKALEQIKYAGYIVAEAIKPAVWQQGFIAELGRKIDYFIHEMG